jgi:hypothetical protein
MMRRPLLHTRTKLGKRKMTIAIAARPLSQLCSRAVGGTELLKSADS